MSSNAKKPKIFILLMLVALASVSAVMYTPAIPAIKQYFGVSGSAVQFTVTIFLIGYVIGQLIYGPLGKAYGRKKTLFIGIFIAIIGSVMCAASGYIHSFDLLLIGRLVSALGSSAGLCMAFMILNDSFEGETARKVSTLVTMAFAVLPSFSVFLGGLITTWFNWEMNFIVLTVYIIVVCLIAITLPETGTDHGEYKIRIGRMCCDYLAVLKNFQFVAYAVMWGLTTAVVYIYAACAPLLTSYHFHMSAAVFGAMNLIVSAALLIGVVSNLSFNKFLSAKRSVLIGSSIGLIGSIVMLFGYVHHLGAWGFFGGICIMYFGMAMILPNAASLSGSSVKDKASGASMMSFLNMAVAVILQWVVSWFSPYLYKAMVTAVPLIAIGFFVLQLFIWLNHLASKRAA